MAASMIAPKTQIATTERSATVTFAFLKIKKKTTKKTNRKGGPK
jgi:hypothetical protein